MPDDPKAATVKVFAENAVGIIFMSLVAAVVLGAIAANAFGIGSRPVDVVVSAERTQEGWQLKGRAILEGELLAGARVWAIASDEVGDRYSPAAVETSPLGEFTLGTIPDRLGAGAGNSVAEITVFVKGHLDDNGTQKVVSGQEILSLGTGSGIRKVQLPFTALLSIVLIFVFSIVLALIQAAPGSLFLKLKFYASLVLAVLFTSVMIAYIAVGLRFISSTGATSEVLSLGFGNFYYGTYVKDVQPEWLFSVTSPTLSSETEAGTSKVGLTSGLGAPLWVLLLSVIGAGVFTISILVSNIKDPVNFNTIEDVRASVEIMVRHQFYMLFAPLGAVLVYQLLVASGIGTEQLTVAMVALASGLTINIVMDKAWGTVQGLFSSKAPTTTTPSV